MHETAVLFRVERAGEFKGTVTAVFPDEVTHVASTELMTCYGHIGQHGSCSRDWLRTTRPATPEEYASLKSELEAAPYEYCLKVIKRIQRRG